MRLDNHPQIWYYSWLICVVLYSDRSPTTSLPNHPSLLWLHGNACESIPSINAHRCVLLTTSQTQLSKAWLQQKSIKPIFSSVLYMFLSEHSAITFLSSYQPGAICTKRSRRIQYEVLILQRYKRDTAGTGRIIVNSGVGWSLSRGFKYGVMVIEFFCQTVGMHTLANGFCSGLSLSACTSPEIEYFGYEILASRPIALYCMT